MLAGHSLDNQKPADSAPTQYCTSFKDNKISKQSQTNVFLRIPSYTNPRLTDPDPDQKHKKTTFKAFMHLHLVAHNLSRNRGLPFIREHTKQTQRQHRATATGTRQTKGGEVTPRPGQRSITPAGSAACGRAARTPGRSRPRETRPRGKSLARTGIGRASSPSASW